VRHGYGRTKTEAKRSGATCFAAVRMVWSLHGTATMRHAVEDWLEPGLSSREKATRDATAICARSTCFRTLGRGSCVI
jgi:hypothetical protein